MFAPRQGELERREGEPLRVDDWDERLLPDESAGSGLRPI